MTKDEAIIKFSRWRRVQEGFVFQRRGGTWDCCSKESPIGNVLATQGAGAGMAANILVFEAVSQDLNAGFPPRAETEQEVERSPAPKPGKRERTPRAHTESDTSERKRPRFKRSLILVGILLMVGGPLCVWSSVGMSTDIDELMLMKITGAVICGFVAGGVGFLLVMVNIFRSGGKVSVT